MNIMEYVKEHWQAILTITGSIVIIASIPVQIWLAKRKPKKPESEKIGYKLGIRIRNLGWKIEEILQIPGKRQTRAELVDLVTSINASMRISRDILACHQSMLIELKKETNTPMTQEQIEKFSIDYFIPLRDLLDEISNKKRNIEKRTWEGIEPCYENEKIKKRI